MSWHVAGPRRLGQPRSYRTEEATCEPIQWLRVGRRTRIRGAARPIRGSQPLQVSTRRRRRFPWKGILLTFVALVLVSIGLAGLAYSMVSIPSPNEMANAQASVVYYADGKTEMTRISGAGTNRESVPIEKIPSATRYAVMAAEDRDFLDNPGVSVTGLGRAVWGVIRGENAGGGSTITQQYVKNYFLTSDQTLTRKAKEIIIAVKIDREQSKDEILANYLNTIYYGRNAYGIQMASKAYFDKDATQLDVPQSAFLASVINEPSGMDPGNGPTALERATDRWNYVLDGMVGKGWLTKSDRDAMTFPRVQPYQPQQMLGGTDGYLVDVIKNQLGERGISDESIQRNGLRITTTIDKDTQAQMVRAVDNNTPTEGRAAGVKIGAVAIKPGDGAILALYGGSDFAKEQFNYATQGHMQAGSTMKGFATLALLQDGKSTRTSFDSSTPYRPLGTTDVIRNWDNQSHGMVTVPQMLAGSINTAFVRLNEQVRPENTMKAAIAAGISPADGEAPANTPGLEPNAANVLGSAAVRPIDLANAYATIAGEGQRAKPYIVKQVTSGLDNTVLYQGGPELTKAFEKNVAADATDALRAVTRYGGTGSGASAVGRPVAGKTGTSNDSKSAWFVGYTPQVSISVGMFLPDAKGEPQSMNGLWGLESGQLPVDVWVNFAQAYLQGKPVEDFPQRVGIGDDKVWTPPPPPTTRRTTSPTTSPTTSSATTSSPDDEATDEETPTPTATRTRTPPGGTNRPAPLGPAADDGLPSDPAAVPGAP